MLAQMPFTRQDSIMHRRSMMQPISLMVLLAREDMKEASLVILEMLLGV
jgi:hypothetical protein